MRGRAAALAAVALLAGCGSSGDTKDANRYVDAVNGAQARLTTTLDRLSGTIGADSSPAQDTRALRAFDTAVARAVTTLRGIAPPGAVRPLHRRLISELGVYGREVRRETAVLRSGDARALVAAQRRLLAATNETSQQINGTIDEINARLRS
jgi:uncharacterized lipoprotein